MRHNQSLTIQESFVKVADVAQVQSAGVLVVYTAGRAIALFDHNDQIYAIDNRCPHMGFPLDRGSVKNCILTCHWHHARFDLTSGGTFDIWADDGQSFPVDIRDGAVWVDLNPPQTGQTHQRERLVDGLEQRLSLVIAKSVIAQLAADAPATEPFQVGLDFGVHYRRDGWGAGLTMHTCMMQLLPYLEQGDRPRALYHGLSAVARDCSGQPPRFPIKPLPNTPADFATLKTWFRQFIEVRDSQGAERCLASAIQAEFTRTQLAEMLFAALTDHRFIDGGHALDFTNKALEALDYTDWQNAGLVLTSLVREYARGDRKEESNAWRYPINLIAMLEQAFQILPEAIAIGAHQAQSIVDDKVECLIPILLGDNPQAITDELLGALREGYRPEQVASMVAYGAALRVAQFQINNDFRDWDSAHHTFTYANAVHQGLKRVPSVELVRGIFDGAMAIYLNRFLNMPPARLPDPAKAMDNPAVLLRKMSKLCDHQQQVNAMGNLVGTYLYSGGDRPQLLAEIGQLLLREDRDFHTIQNVAAAFQLYQTWQHHDAGIHILVATARYLAAHTPTMRSQGQTYEMALGLHKGEPMYEKPAEELPVTNPYGN